jgi:hypothetical protein
MGAAKAGQILDILVVSLSVSTAPQVHAQQFDAADIYSQSSKSVLSIVVKSAGSTIVAQSTSFLVAGGKIVTNKHVVQGGAALIDLGGARIPATVESTDEPK